LFKITQLQQLLFHPLSSSRICSDHFGALTVRSAQLDTRLFLPGSASFEISVTLSVLLVYERAYGKKPESADLVSTHLYADLAGKNMPRRNLFEFYTNVCLGLIDEVIIF